VKKAFAARILLKRQEVVGLLQRVNLVRTPLAKAERMLFRSLMRFDLTITLTDTSRPMTLLYAHMTEPALAGCYSTVGLVRTNHAKETTKTEFF